MLTSGTRRCRHAVARNLHMPQLGRQEPAAAFGESESDAATAGAAARSTAAACAGGMCRMRCAAARVPADGAAGHARAAPSSAAARRHLSTSRTAVTARPAAICSNSQCSSTRAAYHGLQAAQCRICAGAVPLCQSLCEWHLIKLASIRLAAA